MMLMLLLCVIMKIAEELTVDKASEPIAPGVCRLPQCCAKARLLRRRRRPKKRACKATSMMEDPQTPGSDCNSNPANDPQDFVGSEFIQDNMDYQWFIDYSYRDGGLHVHPSVLSSLSASYTKDDLGYYDDLARNLDANLAEVDMESFRTADIHTLLTALPVMCTDPVQHSEFNYQRERYASISGSVMEKLDISSSISPRASSQGEDSACSTTDTISICKSSLLFSPVKEMPVLPPGGSYSVDSLDCEDMLITCQTNNKNNYTIAFEGSIAMYSDGSQDFDNQEKQKVYEVPTDSYYDKTLNLKNMLDLSMACSDSKIYTTWSNLKHSSISKTITRHPSGNNNTTPNFLQSTGSGTSNATSLPVVSNKSRSQSLPDLSRAREIERVEMPLNFSVDSGETSSRSGRLQSSGSLMSRSMNEESSDSVGNTFSSNKKLQNMSLVRLFMKQKSMSTEGMSLTLDQTDSGSETGWPTSSNSESGTHVTQIHKQHNQLQHTQNNLSVPDNDLAIKWVKADNYDIPKRSNCSTSMEDLLNTSRSASSIGRDVSMKTKKREVCTKTTTGIQVMTEVEDNGVQTSLIYPPLNNSNKESGNYPFRETVVNEKPVYVVYPNYTLPDLSFLNSTETRFDNVALKPQVYGKRPGKSGRPFSCNDIDALKQRGFSHVKDWESLTFLLPNEYRKILHDVPEVSKHVKMVGEEARKPLFCLSPPMRHRKRTLSDMIPNTVASSSSSTATQPSSGYRGSSTILTDSSSNQQNSSNTGLGNNNPLYLYRYDSVSSEASLHGQEKLLTNSRQPTQYHYRQGAPSLPKRSISLPQASDCGSAPPRPPLPRSILRKNRAAAAAAGKRCSMFEMGQVNEIETRHGMSQENKRMSLQEPYYMNNDLQLLRHAGIVDSEKDIDEAEERQRFDRLRGIDNDDLESSGEDVKQLEEFLKRSGFSSHSSDGDTGMEHDDIKLRSCVRRFLALKMNQDMAKMIDMADSQKKTVSFAVNGKPRYLDEKTNIMDEKERLNVSESADTNLELRPIDLEDKKKMIWSVNKAVDGLLKFWHSEPVRSRQGYNDKNECSQLCLGQLCPALYAVMSDGLKPQLNSTFGPIANSVWQVVEASSQQGPLTKTLNDLVQKINGEDFMTEGMLKFHAFVFGLLNLRALDAWFAYLCTRESILRKHYNNNSLFLGALGCANSREVIDAFLNILQPLAFCPFQLDLLYQYRQLHNSFGQSNAINLEPVTVTPTKKSSERGQRPRSCVLYDNSRQQYDGEKRALEEIKKRWSHTPLSAKFHVFDRLDDSEDYTDSLEHSPLNRASPKRTVSKQQSKLPESRDSKSRKDEDQSAEAAPAGENKFRKLQEKWEYLGRDDTSPKEPQPPTTPSPSSPTRTPTSNLSKSRIPRLLTSPVKTPSNLPIPVKSAKSPSGIPSLKKPAGIATTTKPRTTTGNNISCKDSPRRTSRLDQESTGTPRAHLTRPSSLPYKTGYGASAKEKSTVSPHRRAASTSLPRPHSIAAPPRNLPPKQAPKFVRTLTSKPQSVDGHLSFNEGDKLKVILEVDGKWLLCARGERKGLVPRSCVRLIPT
ncbi:uncharacterized protein LOC100120175 isoform X5 [Nasonia vitripennis]|uniref:Iporin n=1 Tax=Nasonia vitripennis TaxID=7425 RepID=A0A7M7Q8Y4_NASVI|nr:uncharacterized protein LOC100120175 isoform X5 [Nasonia vitripennis]XP_032453680.1 uncharacterized protein LOC100120175 isoform X5 [Nasonia vitripennis]